MENHVQMEACLTEETIAAFEKACGIHLPQAYHMFLMQVGDGCESMVDGFQLNQLEDLEQKDLSRPFMLEKEWIWECEDDRYGERYDTVEQAIQENAAERFGILPM